MIEKTAWRDLLRQYQQRYPETRVADVYKLVYHVLNGTEHLMSDLAQARELLLSELAELAPPPAGVEESLLETISPRGASLTVLRVHLRPFQALGRDPEKLLTAMAETSLLLPARDAEPLEVVWPELAPLLVEELQFPADEVQTFGRTVELGRFPPVHHSAPYRRAYAPQYRVVARRAWRREFGEEPS